MKYIEKNKYEGAEPIKLHNCLTKYAGCVANNLFFHEVREQADTRHHREILARSAYALIGVCEAVIERVPEDERASALDDVKEEFAPVEDGDVEEAMENLLKAIFG